MLLSNLCSCAVQPCTFASRSEDCLLAPRLLGNIHSHRQPLAWGRLVSFLLHFTISRYSPTTRCCITCQSICQVFVHDLPAHLLCVWLSCGITWDEIYVQGIVPLLGVDMWYASTYSMPLSAPCLFHYLLRCILSSRVFWRTCIPVPCDAASFPVLSCRVHGGFVQARQLLIQAKQAMQGPQGI